MRPISNALLCLTATALAAFSLLSGCASTTRAGNVQADRQQLLLVDSQALNAQAEELYRQELAEAKEKKVLNTDAAMLRKIRAVVNRLAPHTGVFRPDAPDWNWETNLIKSPEVNAYCYPGGKIIVLTGIIEKLSLSDDELAAVLGHEIAHALREHSREQASQAALVNLGAQIVDTFIGQGAGTAASIGGGLVLRSYSRTAETESDRIGVELMARAGYDPEAAISLWKKMMAASGGSGSGVASFLSTHPSNEDRIRTVTADAQTVRPLYDAAKAGTSKPAASTTTKPSTPVKTSSGAKPASSPKPLPRGEQGGRH